MLRFMHSAGLHILGCRGWKSDAAHITKTHQCFCNARHSIQELRGSSLRTCRSAVHCRRASSASKSSLMDAMATLLLISRYYALSLGSTS